MTHQPVIWPAGSGCLALLGVALLGRPQDYTAAVYTQFHFLAAPRPFWGWAFLTVGILSLMARFAPRSARYAWLQQHAALCCAAAVVFCYALWAFMFIAAYFIADFQTSLNPVVLWLLAGVSSGVDFAQHGTGRDTP